VDVIVTSGAGAAAAKQVTSLIPIVFNVATDSLGGGLVASLARPGGNVTGLSNQQADLAGKKIELLREVVPGLRRLAILANVGNYIGTLEIGEAQTAASKLGLEVIISGIRQAEDIAPAFVAFKGRADALYVAGDPRQFTYRLRWDCGCRQCLRGGRTPKWQVSCAMDQISWTWQGALRAMSTRFCAAQTLPTSRSSSRPNSISSSI
jgi:hypothetical protein